jgi:hypothetical protein
MTDTARQCAQALAAAMDSVGDSLTPNLLWLQHQLAVATAAVMVLLLTTHAQADTEQAHTAYSIDMPASKHCQVNSDNSQPAGHTPAPCLLSQVL